MDYQSFLASKTFIVPPSGFDPDPSRTPAELFGFQQQIVTWAIRRGKSAIFADCGLGKTFLQLTWAGQIAARSEKPVLILAPFGVVAQTIREGEKFGFTVTPCRSQKDVPGSGICIANYEILHKFDPSVFGGIVLDESSILKSFDGKTRNQILAAFKDTPFRLACTATPAPNDYMELGNHAEFLGVITRSEMLSNFFVHDGGDTSEWRLMGHSEDDFWAWIASWAVMIRKPSDLGFDDTGFALPTLNVEHLTVESAPPEGMLIAMEARTLSERRKARRASLPDRVQKCVELVGDASEKWLIWCNLNDEQNELAKAFGVKCVSIQGSTPPEKRLDMEKAWREGDTPIMITKPSVFGFGMNWQHCHNAIFCGLSDSYEQYYQAQKRLHRFGQDHEVNCYIVTSEAEGAVLSNIQRKEQDADTMAYAMIEHMATIGQAGQTARQRDTYATGVQYGDGWAAFLGDSVQVMRDMPDNSIHYSIFSPPFGGTLYTYSNLAEDIGNCRDDEEFFEQYKFLVAEQFRTLMPGRLLSFHCMNLPQSKSRHGVIGLRDFRGDLIRVYQAAGFIFHSEVCIWKDPVTAMQRTKALGLLHKQILKDAAMSRQGIPDYVVTMRKPGNNPEPVAHTRDDMPVSLWQRYASPVWMDIQPSDTLQKESAREHKDERHICPLQLEVIERCIDLWSNPGDTIFSPFMGIGSEGYVALQRGRKFVGIELKQSYYNQAVKNLANAAMMQDRKTIFDLIDEAV